VKNLLKNTANTNLPPPPASPTPQKSSRKLLLVAIVIAIIVIAAVGGAIALMSNNASPSNSNSNNNNPASSSPSPSPNEPQTNAVAGASSIKFSVSYTSAASNADWGYTWSAKNLGTPNMMMRMEGSFSGDSSDNSNMIYIVNGVQQKAWMCSNDQWIDLSEGFADQWNSWSDTWEGYYEDFADWSGVGDYTYTNPVSGDSVRIYDVQINPQLADSLFIHAD
jgi:hypothetical protein